MEQHNIKSTLTSHGYYDWTVQQKARLLFQGIKKKDIEHCINQIQTKGLRDYFAGATCHASNYLLVYKACDRGNNHQISGIETCGGGQGSDHGRGRGGGLGGGVRG